MNEIARNLTPPPRDADAAPAMCWSCRGPVGAAALFCPTCRAVQPPRPLDHFARLGLRRDFALDEKELERRYFLHQRQLHPDRFATRTPRERAISQSQAVALNEAYETLKSPLSRAQYLLKLNGIDVNPDGCQTVNDPALLTEQMERREALAEAGSVAEIEAIVASTQRDVDASLNSAAAAFARGDLNAASHDVTRLKYLVKLVEEAKSRKARSVGAAHPSLAMPAP